MSIFQNYIKHTSDNWGELSYGLDDAVRYTDLVDLSTFDLYQNLSLNKIGMIFSIMILFRPVNVFCKTLYHLCVPISIPREIRLAIIEAAAEAERRNLQEPNSCWISVKATLKSLADIGRTPLYGLVLTIIAIVGTFAFFVRPKELNQIRIWHGQVEMSLHWGNKHRCLVECFTPIDNLNKVSRRNEIYTEIPEVIIDENIYLYDDSTRAEVRGLANLAHKRASNSLSLYEKKGAERIKFFFTNEVLKFFV